MKTKPMPIPLIESTYEIVNNVMCMLQQTIATQEMEEGLPQDELDAIDKDRALLAKCNAFMFRCHDLYKFTIIKQ